MSEEYISRSAAMNDLRQVCVHAEDEAEVLRAIAAIPAADVVERPRWIPVAERLPEGGDYVLCWHEYYSYSECRMVTDYGLGYQYNGIWGGEASNGHNARVLYWMPLPEPPEGQK